MGILSKSKSFAGPSALYWSAVLCLGSLILLWQGGLAGLVGGWAVYWPWSILGWWVFCPGRQLLTERKLVIRDSDAWWMLAVVLPGTLLTMATHVAPRAFPQGVGFAEGLDLFDLLGETHEFRDRLEWTADPGMRLEIRNLYGSVRVVPSDTGDASLDITRIVRASSFLEAEQLSRRLSFQVESDGAGRVVRSNQDEMEGGLSRRFRTNLEVRAPSRTPITIENSRGSVEVDGWSGPQTIATRDGDVWLRESAGPIDARVVRGDVRVAFATIPEGASSLEVVDGNLEVDLPGEEVMAVEGDVWPGPVTSDRPWVTLTETSSGVRIRSQGEASGRIDVDVRGGTMDLTGGGRWSWRGR